MQLNFCVTTINGARIKVRDDGRRGPCVADEAVLWDALQEERRGIVAGDNDLLAAMGDEPEAVCSGETLNARAARLVRRLIQANADVLEKNAELARGILDVQAEGGQLLNEIEGYKERLETLQAENVNLRRQLDQAAERVAAQSEALAKKAERRK